MSSMLNKLKLWTGCMNLDPKTIDYTAIVTTMSEQAGSTKKNHIMVCVQTLIISNFNISRKCTLCSHMSITFCLHKIFDM